MYTCKLFVCVLYLCSHWLNPLLKHNPSHFLAVFHHLNNRWVFQWICLQTVFKHLCDGRSDYDSFIRSRSLLLTSRRWIIRWWKNQRVWNGKWYTTVAYRGNLYYKLPQCTVAEPQIALSFSVCMSLYAGCLCVVVCVFYAEYCLCFLGLFSVSFLIWRKRICMISVGQLCACMHASQTTHTHANFTWSHPSAWAQFKW